MSQLVPCPRCSRHVRLSTGSCPFCQATFDVEALDAQYAPRRGGVQAGVKRAVVFAMGATFAAACSDEASPPGEPIYGAPIPSTTQDEESSQPSQPGASSAPPQNTAPSDDTALENTTAPEDNTFSLPIYGAPAAPTSSTEASDVDSASTSGDAGPEHSDAGDGGTRDAAAAGPDTLTDGATFEAGLDAALALDTEPTSVALYGGPPLSSRP